VIDQPPAGFVSTSDLATLTPGTIRTIEALGVDG
jgi:hypothetical protein